MLPTQVQAALDGAGIDALPAVATVYTVLDAARDLRGLRNAVDRFYDTSTWTPTGLGRVTRIQWQRGTTESGQAGMQCITTFDNGATDTAWLAVTADDIERTIEIDDTWPMVVYAGTVPMPYFQGLEDRPFMSPGIAHLGDVSTTTGRMEIVDGDLINPVETELVRVVVSLPRDEDGEPTRDAPVVVWDHGTGGTAYNHVSRKNPADDMRAINQVFADHGVAIVSHDQPMYGTRFPLIDRGFTDGSLGFYNIVNLPAFRDNQRQAALEGHALWRYIQDGWLNRALPLGSVDTGDVRRFGHSLGGLTAHVGVAANPSGWRSAMMSGSAAYLSLSFLETGLVGTSSGIVASLADLFGVELDPGAPINTLIAQGLGIEDPVAASRLDRLHPAVMLFGWVLDPADPAVVASQESLPVTLVMGEGDLQVPNSGTRALNTLIAQSTLISCAAQSDYDPHYCVFREQAGRDAIATWLETP
jgi:hypothetical protein